MADTTGISWTDHTFNPWIGCHKVSAGCDNCYAHDLVTGRMGRKGVWGPPRTTRRDPTSEAYWRKPYRWTGRVFCGSLCDVFERHPDVEAPRLRLWRLIRETPDLQWQLLTKRPEIITAALPDDWGVGYPNVWLGVSVEDMRVAHRLDTLRTIPAAVRFISYEPALGPLDVELSGFDWLIYGGESGPRFRRDDDEWARFIRARCREAGVSFFYKQASGRRPGSRPTLDGVTYHEFPVGNVAASPDTAREQE